jgi:Mn2+/Fe2+ NRAMP family transporter
VTLIPGLPLVKVLIITQLINALALPFVLVSVLKLVNNRGLMGEYRNGVAYNIVAWATTIIVSVLSVAILLNTLLGLVGLGFA